MGNKIGYLVEKKETKKTSLFKLKKKQGHRYKPRALVRENVKKLKKKTCENL